MTQQDQCERNSSDNNWYTIETPLAAQTTQKWSLPQGRGNLSRYPTTTMHTHTLVWHLNCPRSSFTQSSNLSIVSWGNRRCCITTVFFPNKTQKAQTVKSDWWRSLWKWFTFVPTHTDAVYRVDMCQSTKQSIAQTHHFPINCALKRVSLRQKTDTEMLLNMIVSNRNAQFRLRSKKRVRKKTMPNWPTVATGQWPVSSAFFRTWRHHLYVLFLKFQFSHLL